MSFIAYPHLERIGKEDVEGIIAGDCYIFPKIDGTNASLWVDKIDPVPEAGYPQLDFCAGSRNRQLSLESDNAGFMEWASKQENFRKFFMKNPECRLYGEWLVPHTFKGYREAAWRNFYVFDVGIIDEKGELCLEPYEYYKPLLDKYEIEYIPAQKIIKNPSDEELKHEMNNNFYLMDSRDVAGEGIVIKNYEYKNKWGRQTWAKMVREEFKEANTKQFGTAEGGEKKIEEDIINQYITLSALPEKTYDKIKLLMPEGGKGIIPRTLETVYHDLVTEECWNFIKEHNNPTINFKLLKALCINATKKKLPQMFL